jgi:hypothetical protein
MHDSLVDLDRIPHGNEVFLLVVPRFGGVEREW